MDDVAIIILVSLLPLWIVSLFLFSRAAWHHLAKEYRYAAPYEGLYFGKLHARINDLNYRTRLKLQYNENGMYLHVVLRYRVFHPPILIPWDKISNVKYKNEQIFLTIRTNLRDVEIEITTQSSKKIIPILEHYTEFSIT